MDDPCLRVLRGFEEFSFDLFERAKAGEVIDQQKTLRQLRDMADAGVNAAHAGSLRRTIEWEQEMDGVLDDGTEQG